MNTILYKRLNKKLYKKWDNLWRKVNWANYTNSPQWFISAVSAIKPSNYVVVATYEKSNLVAVGALLKTKLYGVEVYMPPFPNFGCGMPFLMDLKNKRIAKSFMKKIKKVFPVVLDNMPLEISKIFNEICPESYFIAISRNYSLSVVKDANNRVKVKDRGNLICRAKNFESKFEFISFLKSDLPHALNLAVDIERKSHKYQRCYDTFSEKKVMIFFNKLIEYFHEFVRINILYFQNSPIAYNIGFLIKDCYFSNQIAFDKEYSSYAPGKYMEVKLIDYLSDINVKKVDYGSGNSQIKRLITKDYALLTRVVFSNNVLLRKYLIILSKLQTYIFETGEKHKVLYLAYRKLRKVFMGSINPKIKSPFRLEGGLARW